MKRNQTSLNCAMNAMRFSSSRTCTRHWTRRALRYAGRKRKQIPHFVRNDKLRWAETFYGRNTETHSSLEQLRVRTGASWKKFGLLQSSNDRLAEIVADHGKIIR